MDLRHLICLAITLLALCSLAECSSKDNKSKDKDDGENPCEKVKCTSGQECTVDSETGEGKCTCIRECADNTDSRRRVCSNFNQTWQSDCHLVKHRCDCLEGSLKDCTDDHKHMHINYYGECKEIEKCQEEVLEDFPRRMREWLDNIISRRIAAPSGQINLAHKWIDAIIWKFCDLDQEPHDRHVSRHELFPLRAPLLSMESCVGVFLDGCDANDDHKITLVEWGKCLGATEDEMQDKCNQFHSIKKETQVLVD